MPGVPPRARALGRGTITAEGRTLTDAARLRAQRVGRLLALSMTNVFAWIGFSTLSMLWLNAGQAAMPIWATLLAWPLSGQRPSVRASGGLL